MGLRICYNFKICSFEDWTFHNVVTRKPSISQCFLKIEIVFILFSEKAPRNPITCVICTDLIELADEQLLANSTIEQVQRLLNLTNDVWHTTFEIRRLTYDVWLYIWRLPLTDFYIWRFTFTGLGVTLETE